MPTWLFAKRCSSRLRLLLQYAAVSAAFLLLESCALPSNKPFSTFDELPANTNTSQVRAHKTNVGWQTTSMVLRNGTNQGTACEDRKRVEIVPGLTGNVVVVRVKCEIADGLTASEAKWFDFTVREFNAMAKISPIVRQQFINLGNVEFDWYLIEPNVRFRIEKESEMGSHAPHLAIGGDLPKENDDDYVFTANGILTIISVLHEYFHMNVRRSGWKFESASLEETIAYLINHSASVTLGADQALTPKSIIASPLDNAWSEAQQDDGTTLHGTTAGLRLAYVMVKKAKKCTHPRSAIKGLANLAYTKLTSQRAMTFADLRVIDALPCEALEAAESESEKLGQIAFDERNK
jgi:hypothetical protein